MKTSAAATAVDIDIVDIQIELDDSAHAEGFIAPTLTGKIYFCATDGSLWYEIKNEVNTTSFVSKNFPHRAAYGETLVAADDENEIEMNASDPDFD